MAQEYDKKYLEKVAKKVLKGKASEEEALFLNEYYDAFDRQPDITDNLPAGQRQLLGEEIKASLLMRLQGQTVKVVPLYQRGFFKIAVAAAVLMFILVGAYIVITKPGQQQVAHNQLKKDILPGGNKAILTLANGSRIILNNAGNGVIATQGNVNVKKVTGGQLTYTNIGPATGIIVSYNTMTTPRGGQFKLILPDGTQVWLNSASSITYPVAFLGNERNVTITGEAYFEVAKDKAKPFHVKSGEQNIEVLGTHFNINAYADEKAIKTTLLEGSIAVSRAGSAEAKRISPGQQSVIRPFEHTIAIQQADVEEAVAWKNGSFYFNGADLQSIMRQVARWYDVEVVYEGKIPDGHYKGKPSRNLTAAQMLKVLEYSGVKFKIEDKKIILIP